MAYHAHVFVGGVGWTSYKSLNARVDMATYRGGGFVSGVGWTSYENPTACTDTVAYRGVAFVSGVGWTSYKNLNARVDTMTYRGGDFVGGVGWTSDKNQNAPKAHGAGELDSAKKKPGIAAARCRRDRQTSGNTRPPTTADGWQFNGARDSTAVAVGYDVLRHALAVTNRAGHQAKKPIRCRPIPGEVKMGVFKLFGKTHDTKKSENTPSQQPTFVRKDARGVGVYEIYRGTDAESAKAFLLAKKVDKQQYYLVVETPDGNWGTDIQGLYLEHLRPWQMNIGLAECDGALAPYSIFGVQMAAKRINDNFIARVVCGKCQHDWLDGVQYQNITVVRCPNCKAYNKVNSNNIYVDTVEVKPSQRTESNLSQNNKPDEELVFLGLPFKSKDTKLLETIWGHVDLNIGRDIPNGLVNVTGVSMIEQDQTVVLRLLVRAEVSDKMREYVPRCWKYFASHYKVA